MRQGIFYVTIVYLVAAIGVGLGHLTQSTGYGGSASVVEVVGVGLTWPWHILKYLGFVS